MNKLLLTLSLILSCTFFAMASNSPSSNALTLLPNETSFIIDFDMFEGGVNYVTIKDKSGKVVFIDEIEANKQRIKYVLDDLPVDQYTVKIKGDNLVEYYTIHVAKDFTNLVEVKTYSSPIIINQANKIIVKDNNSEEHISLTIYNDDENLVYSFSEDTKGNYQKVFNLDQLEEGQYRVLVSNEEYTKELKVTLK